jgi:transcriptional regulator with XRE-family HTH domain
MTAVGENLKRLRKAAEMTQQQVAMAAGLSISIVSQIEQGSNQDPRGSTLQALALALNTTVDALLRTPSPRSVEKRRKRKSDEGSK